ncbi:amidohydrolase [Aerococcaceae bacterium zg-BR9]|uniref:M20 metallopeptidase family protein n=1 Tax=Aerococcaceae bacterium zg-1292 TaxID=2774330 RepID=UPI004062F9F9|nr:amidohydrolase [Aerococcaceae bacterium zg-BR9]
MKQLKQYIEQYYDEIVAHRRYLHQHPELSLHEKETAHYVSKQLTALGIAHQINIGGHGVVGLIEGAFPGPTLLIRADMDALPIQEATNLPFASENPNIMHACGHDIHTANLLGIAKILLHYQSSLHGNVKLVFQPAEEGHNGANSMIADGIMENPTVDYAIGLHIEPHLKLGTVAIEEGPISAYPEFFTIQLHGRGGHGSLPYASVDPLRAGVHLYQLIHDLHKEINPLHPHVIQICSMQAGEAPAVIPDYCVLKGTVRTHFAEDKDHIQQRIRQLTQMVESFYHVESSIQYHCPATPVFNDPEKAEIARHLMDDVFPEGLVSSVHFKMVGEDFASFSDRVPATFLVVGCSEDLNNYYPLHNAQFNPNEAVIKYGSHALLKIALHYLNVAH